MAMTDVAPTADRPGRPEPSDDDDGGSVLAPGTTVEVRSRLESRRWSRGFEIAEAVDGGYRLRRLSDGSLMPVIFAADDVRTERRRGTWWY